jgi:endonuclease III
MSTRRRESGAETKTRARRIVRTLHKLYPGAGTELRHRDPLELLVATILSAQCTDARVNLVTPALFAKYRTAADFARAKTPELEKMIHSTGFFRNKAKAIIGLGRALTDRHGGKVPETMEALVELPGVGRKTANVLLGSWFGRPAIAVDTHVKRVAGRLALTDETDPVAIERDLQEVFPEKDWSFAASALIWHGRRVCHARKPDCPRCALRPDCPFPNA